MEDIEFDEVIEKVAVIDPEANSEEPKRGCRKLRQREPKLEVGKGIPRHRCLSREERREAIRVETLEERR